MKTMEASRLLWKKEATCLLSSVSKQSFGHPFFYLYLHHLAAQNKKALAKRRF